MAKNRRDPKNYFLGTYLVKLDAKNRLMFPSKWKHFIGMEVVIKKGYEGCCELRTVTAFEAYCEEIVDSANTDKQNRIMKRVCLGSAHSVNVDSWSRFVLPEVIIKEYGIEKDVYLVGIGNTIEIWSDQAYGLYMSNSEHHLAGMDVNSTTTEGESEEDTED